MNNKSFRKEPLRRITRREFVGGALAAGTVITAAPAFLRGQNLNNRLNIAMIACGGRGLANMNGDGPAGRGRGAGGGKPAPDTTPAAPTGIPRENITVLCDIDQNAVDA